ncbi:hypothetical protein OF829_14505 [Sphingomonas sp. LB-2]|uniref:hypothetical protein n=1 Tax=Sphingomonas caeni TaxID=2984949 RepID=UPI002232C564|nr:hypothetical protein [Sphingomonas caeni]MCW3848449.1 hypothetical protein [Sphingomonas caeni]
MRSRRWAVALAATATFVAPGAWAQDAAPAAANGPATGTAAATDAPPQVSVEDRGELRIDPAKIQVPDINFVATPEIEANFDKYFFFWREGTDFETALADIRECDDYARGASYHTAYTNPYMYGYGVLPSAIGGAIGSAIADAIFGSAARRRQRWQNLRICMGYKEYGRYGVPKDAWEQFNFSEGNGRISERRRQGYLQQQARIASGARPGGKVLEP